MILSGSCRRIERSPRAKVSPFFSFTGICSTPGSWYSTGSSIVTILSCPLLISEIIAYSVVVLPLPVGPVTSTMPYGSRASRRRVRIVVSSKPSELRRTPCTVSARSCLSRIRSTASSPMMLGMMETRKSIWRPLMPTLKRPSCGTRRSAMSSSAMTLTREITCSATSEPGTRLMDVSTPSTRYLIASPLSVVSRWMSLACAFRAS